MATVSVAKQKAIVAKTAKKTAKPPRKAAAKTVFRASGNSPDAIALLMKDHRDAKAKFKAFEKAEGHEAKKDIATAVCKMLVVHTTIEEEIFYPALRAAGMDVAEMDEADVEHASAKELIAQIQKMQPGQSHYDAKVKVLGEYINHHVEEEETGMFKRARRLKLDFKELGRELKERATVLKAEVGLTEPPSSVADVLRSGAKIVSARVRALM